MRLAVAAVAVEERVRAGDARADRRAAAVGRRARARPRRRRTAPRRRCRARGRARRRRRRARRGPSPAPIASAAPSSASMPACGEPAQSAPPDWCGEPERRGEHRVARALGERRAGACPTRGRRRCRVWRPGAAGRRRRRRPRGSGCPRRGRRPRPGPGRPRPQAAPTSAAAAPGGSGGADRQDLHAGCSRRSSLPAVASDVPAAQPALVRAPDRPHRADPAFVVP